MLRTRFNDRFKTLLLPLLLLFDLDAVFRRVVTFLNQRSKRNETRQQRGDWTILLQIFALAGGNWNIVRWGMEEEWKNAILKTRKKSNPRG